jgi:hypothetical protein
MAYGMVAEKSASGAYAGIGRIVSTSTMKPISASVGLVEMTNGPSQGAARRAGSGRGRARLDTTGTPAEGGDLAIPARTVDGDGRHVAEDMRRISSVTKTHSSR